MIPDYQMPSRQDLLWPTLKALDSSGGSASIQELSRRVAMYMKLPDEILNIPHKEGPQTEVDYQAAWARSILKNVGAIDNTARGVWTITDKGREVQSDEQARAMARTARPSNQKSKQRRGPVAPDPDTPDADDDRNWQDGLLDILRSMEPDAFERLCQRILRESGFTRVEVTGRSGDGGIDGAGVLRVNLISFHVRFQCKRYSGSVQVREIRDFRGAMVGRADKGLFITTGAFTGGAQREAVRDGAPAIDLIDGSELCELLKDLELGVTTRTVLEVAPEPEFFDSI